MEVRCRKKHEQCRPTCSGYFSTAECSKVLTHEELDALLNPHGLRRISHYYRSHAVSAIYQKYESGECDWSIGQQRAPQPVTLC